MVDNSVSLLENWLAVVKAETKGLRDVTTVEKTVVDLVDETAD